MTNPPARTWQTALSRRAAFGVAGMTAASMVGVSSARAQPATPMPVASEDARKIFMMFVQTATAGSFLPKEGEPGVWEVTLNGVGLQTIYFSDRPERIVGTVDTAIFLDGLGFSPANPPNAAIVAQTDQGEDILVVELLNPRWNDAELTLTYDVQILDDYVEDGLGNLVQRQDDDDLPETFGQTSLFIDDCADAVDCTVFRGVAMNGQNVRKVGLIPGGPYGQCWSWSSFGCYPCWDVTEEYLEQLCNETYPACENRCFV